MMGSRTLCLVLATLVIQCDSSTHTQAPGDENERCTGAEDAVTYPDTVRNLMDSYNYVQLLPGNGTGNPPIEGAVWTDRSVDGNDAIGTTNPTYWQHGGGGICRFQVRVCGWQRDGGQDNWLFTQHISQDFDYNTYTYPVEIHVELVHALSSCRKRFGCDPTFKLYYYATNTTQLPITGGSGFMNTDNYVQFARVRPADTIRTFTKTFNFTLQPNVTGFYFAIRDNGTCVGISRVRVYRENCQSFQSGLVLYPDAPAPVSDSENITISCVPNANIFGSAQAKCYSNGTWGAENLLCKCNTGYEASTDGMMCRPCEAGYFKSEDLDVCTVCPQHSSSESPAASVCQCTHHHYRRDDDKMDSTGSPIESATSGCTKAPSKPINVAVTVSNTTISVSWEQPLSDGGRPQDMFYRLHLQPVSGSDEQRGIVPGSPRLSYTFRDLKPVTEYMVSVQADNGVSYLDDRVEERREMLRITTAEGNPEEVFNPKAVDNVVCVWGPPKVPNGEITGYEIMLLFCPTDLDDGSGSGAGNESQVFSPTVDLECQTAVHAVDASTLFFVLNNEVLPDYEHNLTYSIRAKTGEDRFGVWSPEETIVPKIVCPRLPPVPTCPTIVCSPTPTPTFTNQPPVATGCPTNPPHSPASEPNCDVVDCVIFMGVAAGGIFVLSTILMCLFSCTIAWMCHTHKMKVYKINAKKQMQSKWEY